MGGGWLAHGRSSTAYIKHIAPGNSKTELESVSVSKYSLFAISKTSRVYEVI